ncbi:MAG: alpha/beta hydrolase [Acetobacteraceae bacterium]|nr:alpha/beta hydrolase [Acetobacteraceae bacterium]
MTMQPEPRGEVRSVIAADGARLEYEVAGNGPPLVMLHGFLAGRWVFSRQRAALAERFCLILPSFRGHDGSDSTVPPGYGPGTSDVDDLNAILDAEHIDRLCLLGHSSGGATAFVFACRYPDRVLRTVLIEPTLYSLLDTVARNEVSAQMGPLVATAVRDGPAAALRDTMATIGGDAWNNLDPEKKETRLTAFASCAPMVGPHIQGLLDLQVSEADVTGFRPETLLVYGAASFPFEASIGERFVALRPESRIVTVEGAGHNVHRDRADILNPMVLSFLV